MPQVLKPSISAQKILINSRNKASAGLVPITGKLAARRLRFVHAAIIYNQKSRKDFSYLSAGFRNPAAELLSLDRRVINT
jgi:hypothetical protein